MCMLSVVYQARAETLQLCVLATVIKTCLEEILRILRTVLHSNTVHGRPWFQILVRNDMKPCRYDRLLINNSIDISRRSLESNYFNYYPKMLEIKFSGVLTIYIAL